MNIDSLKLFYHVAQANSISLVAKQNHISQSALSQQLFKLEEKLDVKLFNRSNKGVTLTKEGEIVLKHCSNIFSSSESLLQELNSLKRNKEIITIKAPEVITSTLLSASLLEIRKRYTKFNINLFNIQCLNDEVTNNLGDDITFSYVKRGSIPGVICEKIFDDEFILISKDPSAPYKITTKEIFTLPLVAVDDLLNAHTYLYDELSKTTKTNKKLNIILTTQSYCPALFTLSNTNAFLLVPKSAYLSYYKGIGFNEVQIVGLKLPMTLFMSYSETLIKNEKRFINAFKRSTLCILNQI